MSECPDTGDMCPTCDGYYTHEYKLKAVQSQLDAARKRVERLEKTLKRLANSTPSSSVEECHEIIDRVVSIATQALEDQG